LENLVKYLFFDNSYRHHLFISEYCKTRSFPTVKKSEYLNTIGEKLHPDIDILWTGDKVISQVVTPGSIIELSKVLRRKPVLWDNIHANDYDHRRVFLGPYSGRPVELYKLLNGVLTNPNCEFEANFIAIHTLATWCQVASNSCRGNTECTQEQDSCDLGDEDPMEVQVDSDNIDVPEADGTMQIDLYPLTPADVTSVVTSYDPKSALKLAVEEWLEEFDKSKPVEMKSYAKRHTMPSLANGQTVYTGQYSLDITNGEESCEVDNTKAKSSDITLADLYLLIDLFYLPYEHGDSSKALLEGFSWLRENSSQLNSGYQLFNDKEHSWKERAANFHSLCQMVLDLFTKLSSIPNESVLFDLYPYIWDVKEVVLTLHSYVIWMATSHINGTPIPSLPRDQDFSNDDISVADFIVDDFIEAWHPTYIGGVTVAMLRLLPFNGGFGFLDYAPDFPSSDLFHVRPFLDSDKEFLLQLSTSVTKSLKTTSSVKDFEDTSNNNIEPYVDNSSNTLFVLEHNHQICGYVAAVPCNKKFMESIGSSAATTEDDLCSVKRPGYYPYGLKDFDVENRAHLFMHIDQKTKDARVFRRILNMILSVLKSLGSSSVILETDSDDELDLYARLGFQPFNSDMTSKVVLRTL